MAEPSPQEKAEGYIQNRFNFTRPSGIFGGAFTSSPFNVIYPPVIAAINAGASYQDLDNALKNVDRNNVSEVVQNIYAVPRIIQSEQSAKEKQEKATKIVQIGASGGSMPQNASGAGGLTDIFAQIGVKSSDEVTVTNTPNGKIYTNKEYPSREVFVPYPAGVTGSSGKITPKQVDWTQLEGYNFKKVDPDEHGDNARYIGPDGRVWLESQAKSYVADQQNTYDPLKQQQIDVARQNASAAQTSAGASWLNAQTNAGQLELARTLQPYQIEEIQNRIKIADGTLEIAKGNLADSQAKTRILQGQADVAKDLGYKDLALKTEDQISRQQALAADTQIKIATMQSQRDALQAQLNVQVATENARNQLATQQANLQYQAQREARLQSLAGDIGKLAADPGSRAQLAATLLANRGWGQAPGALRQSQITEESLQPLAQDLELRKSIEAQPLNPYQFTPIQAPQLGPLDLSKIAIPTVSTKPFVNAMVPTAPIPATGGTTLSYAQQAEQANKAMQDAGVPSWVPSFSSAPPPTSVDTSGGTNSGGGTTGLALGGLTRSGQFIVGDSKSGRPTGYEELIINPTGAPIKVIPNNEVQRYYGGTSVPRYAIGTTGTGDNPSDNGGTSLAGFFSGINRTDAVKGPEDGVSSWETNQPSDQMPAATYVPTADNTTANENASTAAARSFLAEALNKALTGTPWKSTNLPTSVYASTPGMDPVVAQLMASLNAMARGVPESTFLRQASLLAPSGMSQSVTRRTG